MRVAFAVLMLLLAGCVTHWAKPGATQADFQRDHRECEQQASVYGPVVVESRYADCMHARGYAEK